MSEFDNNHKKVTETKALLLEIIKNPEDFKTTEPLKLALKSQMAIAKFTDEDRGITPCSLNTLKSASERILARGFTELNELRINAKNAIVDAVEGEKANKSTRTGLKHTVSDLEAKLNTINKSNFLLTMMVTELRADLKNMALSDSSIEQKEEKYREVNRKVETKLSYTLEEKDFMVAELLAELKKMTLSNSTIEQKEEKYQEVKHKVEAKLSYTFDGGI